MLERDYEPHVSEDDKRHKEIKQHLKESNDILAGIFQATRWMASLSTFAAIYFVWKTW